MSSELDKILKALAKELKSQVTLEVTEALRKDYVADITAIANEIINKNQFNIEAGSGFVTIEAISEKYKVSRKTVTDKCKQFKEGNYKIERKWVNGHNTINEKQYVEACDYSSRKFKPQFLKKKDAA